MNYNLFLQPHVGYAQMNRCRQLGFYSATLHTSQMSASSPESHVTIWTWHSAWANISCFSAHGFWIGLLVSSRLKIWAKQIHNCLQSLSKASPQKNHSYVLSKWALMSYDKLLEDQKNQDPIHSHTKSGYSDHPHWTVSSSLFLNA